NISFKLAPQPFSVGAERYAYYALDTKRRRNYNIAFSSTKFNEITKRVGVNKKVIFIDVKYYAIRQAPVLIAL
ncbi:12573_t:CDS:2, partial [Racocetra persica]